MRDILGDRQKALEMREAKVLFSQIPILARIDGRTFSNFTMNMERPYDVRMSNLMIETTKWLVEQTCACCGYTQSDEITLTWYAPDRRTEVFFGGRLQKMCSQLAALASVFFNNKLPEYFPNEPDLYAKLPTFDTRVWNVPTLTEAANCFLWREWDATKNSVSMAARHYFSHASLLAKNGKEMQEMLWKEHKINWNDYPVFFKRGTYLQRRKRYEILSAKDLALLPPEHNAHKNPDMKIERSEVVVMEMPRFASVQNREGVIFDGEDPVILEE